MSRFLILPLLVCAVSSCLAESRQHATSRSEAEYFVAAYAEHYRVPVPLVRAIVEHESNWRACAQHFRATRQFS